MNARRGARLFMEFARIEAVACSFAFSLIGCLALTRYVSVPGVPRYDLVFLLCLGIQGVLVWRGVESWRDVGVVAVFHVVGVCLEWYKVHAGSWSYPEFAYLKVNGVPLYGGFMYASIASYMVAAWRMFDLRFTGWPRGYAVASVMAVVYGQFFIPMQALVVRLVVLGILAAVFARCAVLFTVDGRRYRMAAPVALLLIGFFVWLAENIATYFGAWVYPNQAEAWQPVHVSKVVSWTMLMVVSLSIVHYYQTVPWLQGRRALQSQE